MNQITCNYKLCTPREPIILYYNFCTDSVLFSAVELRINCTAFSQSNLRNFAQHVISGLIILYMKLPWFCHTNSGQYFMTALGLGLSFGGKPAARCCLSFVASKLLKINTASLLCRTNLNYKNTTPARQIVN